MYCTIKQKEFMKICMCACGEHLMSGSGKNIDETFEIVH